MGTTSISGLASGLDTATIIDQLMQLEAVSQNRLKTKQAGEQKALTSLQSLNSSFASLQTAAANLAKPTSWQSLKATSSSPLVTVTTGTSPAATSFSITVDSLASAAQTAYAEDTQLSAAVVTGPVNLTAADGTSHAIATGTGSLADLVSGINAAKAGVTATAVRTGTDTYRLQLTADSTGAAQTIGLTGVSLTPSGSTIGSDARIRVGSQGIASTSKTNIFTDLTPGVTVTLDPSAVAGGSTPTTATIRVAQDTSGVKATVKALVDQVNAVLTTIDTQSAHSSTGTAAGVLSGDATVRSLRNALAGTVFGTDNTSLSTLGIQTDRDGKLVFDGDAFDKAYTADPVGTAARFTSATATAPDGFAARVAAVAKAASDSTTGTLTSAIAGRKSSIDRLGNDIDDWDTRLELRRTSLTRQYTALETALSSMQSQGNWLAGQIAHLPTSS